MYLSNIASGRDNNLNLLRLAAASAVLVSHSFVLVSGEPASEPLRATTGMTTGSIAVDIFFIASGFLVTGSLLKSRSPVDFVWARILRIFPGLTVMLLLTTFGLGPLVTSIGIQDYFVNSQTYIYFIKCATLITGVSYELPGVFELNPYRGAVNGSLWTMPHEILMYGILLCTWLIPSKFFPDHSEILFKGFVLCSTAISGAAAIYYHFRWGGAHTRLWLFFMFFSGSSAHLLKHRIYLSKVAFLCLSVIIILLGFTSKDLFFVAYALGIWYGVIYLAYVPSGHIRRYNHVGDYSYGIYVYAFPIQQAIAALLPNVSVCQMMLFSSSATLAMAIPSWHLIERKGIRLKALCISRMRRAAFTLS